MTPTGKSKLKAFLITLLLFATIALLFKVVRLGQRVDTFRYDIRAEQPSIPSYKVRCEALGCAHARLHDATANVMYDEVCICGNLPGE